MTTATRTTRTFQPKHQPAENELWYTPLPQHVMWGIYARQSTPAQLIKHAESTEMQTDDLIAWLGDRGVEEGNWKLFDADLGKSGTLRIDQRTGLQELVERIKADEIKAVLVYQISRLFRDDTGVQYNTFAEICKQHTCVLVTSDGMVFNFYNRMHLKMFRFLAEYAAEYIPQQLGLLHAAKLRKARKGFHMWSAPPTGYVVDGDKSSPTYQRLIPYWPHAKKILEYLERFYQLEGDMSTLCRELEELPYLFPPFESWVDARILNNKRWKGREVPGGGYGITRKGLELLLCNPVLIGWWIVQGDIVSRQNHEPIIDKTHEYLFWYAFEQLSPYNIDGTVNDKRAKEPRRFFQKATVEKPGLLKKRIVCPGCRVHVHVINTVAHYALIPEEKASGLLRNGLNDIPTHLIDDAFTKRFLERLQESHDFDEYRRWLSEATERKEALVGIIGEQLAEIDRQQEVLLDEKLAIRSRINDSIRQAKQAQPDADEEQLRAQFEVEAGQELDRLQKRTTKLNALAQELRAKLPTEEETREIETARKYQDFQTEVRKLIPVWGVKPIEVRREFVNLFVGEVTLEVVSPHWVRLTIQWRHPAWETDMLFVYRHHGPTPFWTEEETEVLVHMFPTALQEDVLMLLPLRSWDSIRHKAKRVPVQRTVPTVITFPEQLTWADWQFMQEEGIDLDSQVTKCVSLSECSRS